LQIYGEEFGLVPSSFLPPEAIKYNERRDKSRAGRKISDQSSSHTSPSRRKDSTGRRDRIIHDDSEQTSSQYSQKMEEKKEIQENCLILKYVKNHVRDLFHVTLSTLVKGAVVLSEDQFIEVIPAAWELLLETNQETAAAAAAFFILASVKAPNHVTEIMQRSLKHKDPNVRISAILRFQVLWKSRFQVWPRMEEGAHVTFKVPPPGIEFTLPSPKIGIEALPVVDPPWQPRQQSKDVDVTLNQERHRQHFVTATKTRKKQQRDAIRQALRQQDEKQRQERHCFLITSNAITQQAAHERLDHGPGEDHDPLEEEEGARAVHHAAHSLFPSILCSVATQIISSLDDCAVGGDGTAVYEVAYQVIWSSLVEDSALFLRYILERLTREKQELMFKTLRHLIRFVPRLPQQAAFVLYNYIIGYVMFYVRTTHENSQHLIGSALSILWMVVHSVHGIMFKDLKQILRKEQCDASVLLTANVPSAKKIIVHGPTGDDGSIPSQFPIMEDTQFLMLKRESLDFFGIDEKNFRNYFLVDYKTHQILNSNWFVRDLYFFKRSQYPQLRLVEMKTDEAFAALQRQELIKKLVEIGKVHLTWAILKNVDQVVQRVVFLHEELMKLPSFPRKALETDLDLYVGGELGKELMGLDVLHKFMWVRLIARMFEAMAGNFAYSADIQLFLNVLSGAAILHSEDSCIMRYVMATFINGAFNFKNIFSTNGYFMIMPTLLQIYSLHQTNKLITTTIEYAVKQFYLMNRKPFILQMFGSVSAILDTDEDGAYGEATKVQSSCLFNLLLSLETPSPDPLNIAELVREPKPLKAIDFCYHDEDEMVTVLDCITLCVMTVSYSPESTRGYQMLIILEAILPCYMQQIQSPSYIPLEGKCERDIILQLAITIRTMVHNCEGLSKSYNGPYRNSPEHKGSSQRNQCSRGPPPSPGFDFEDSHSKYVSDMRGKNMPEMAEDSELVRTEYRRARDVLLSLVGEFLNRGTTRLQELAKKPGADSKPVELLDVKCHIRLADVAHSLLKVSPYDPDSMACRGLQRYMTYILPRAEWGDEKMKTALTTILRRLDKVFLKISKKSSIRRNTDWEAAAGLLKGIHETLLRCPFVLHWQQMRSLMSTIQNLIVNESSPETVSGASAALMSQSPPAFFCSTAVRLIALQVVSPGDYFNLEQVCGIGAEFPTQEKAEGFLMHLLMPLCLKICSGRGVSDIGELKDNDISFLITVVLNAMSPPSGRTAQSGLQNRVVSDIRAGSLTFTGSRDAKRPAKISGTLYQAAFLTLKVICVCFESRLANEWPRIARVMRDLGRRNEAAPELWSFLEFAVTTRVPLFIVLMPFILHKISQPPIGDHERHMQFLIRERLRGSFPVGGIKSRGCLLLELARELKDLRDEMEERRNDGNTGSSENKKDSATTPVPPMTSNEGTKQTQRPSLISIFTSGGQHPVFQHDSRSGTGGHTPSDTLSQHTLQPPRESISSSSTTTNKDVGLSDNQSANGSNSTPTTQGTNATVISRASSIRRTSRYDYTPPNMSGSVPHLPHSISIQHGMKMQPPKLRFVSSVEFKDSTGETSTTPLSPDSPIDDSSGNEMKGHRLQRSKGQSRKTFRYKRGRMNVSESTATLTPTNQQGSSTPPLQLPSSSMQPVYYPTQAHDSDNGRPPTDASWDSVSQTSSTSGYRDNYSFQTGFLSPDGSLNLNDAALSGNLAVGPRSSSQNSLLLLFEAQDEDTLI
jgi:protein unc-80